MVIITTVVTLRLLSSNIYYKLLIKAKYSPTLAYLTSQHQIAVYYSYFSKNCKKRITILNGKTIAALQIRDLFC